MMATELQMLDFIQQFRTSWLDHIMVFFTTLGNGGVIWIGIGILLLTQKKHRTTGILLLIALAVEVTVGNGILKPLIARVRPCDINHGVQLFISRPTDYSFPSGHTGASFAAAGMLWIRRERGRFAAVILAGCIAFSRMYLYVHYPTDILGGILLGIGCAGLVCMLEMYGKGLIRSIRHFI